MSLDELERAYIRAARQDLAPSEADRERHQALLGRLAGAEPRGGAAGAGLQAQGGSAGVAGGRWASVRQSRLGTLGVGLVVGAVVGGWLGFGLGQRSGGAALRAAPVSMPAPGTTPGTTPPEHELAASDATGALAALDAPAADAAAPPSALDPAALTTASAPDGKDAPRARSLARRPTPPSRPESSLARELAMLQRARRALNAHNGRLALGIVEELDERFPDGVLIEERSATRVLSLCQLERVGEAKQAAQDFLARYPASVYAERVRKSCAAAARG